MSDEKPEQSHQAPRSNLHEQVLACLRGDWKALVVIPADPSVSSLALAEALVDASRLVTTRPTILIKAEGLAEAAISQLIVEMVDHVHSGGRVVVAAESVLGRQATIPFVIAADAALLCVRLGLTSIENARRTIELVGRERFIGAVTLENSRPH